MFILIVVKLTINKGYPKPENHFRPKKFLLQLSLLLVKTTMYVRVFVIQFLAEFFYWSDENRGMKLARHFRATKYLAHALA